ncbi:MAG TPA: DNA polymerase III subunit delta [Gammaproteobacteria bacterium]|nr:DNA polymerase III subunit delta [Gammaproteobacteria bacterium]
MKLSASTLPKALASGLRPLYVILGEEPLTAREAGDAVRATARAAGFAVRIPLFAEPGFDWGLLHTEGATGSLFGDRRLVDLKLPGGKPDAEGARALAAWFAAPPADVLLLVTAIGAERKAAQTAWAKAAEKAGVLVECRPIPATDLPGWIKERLRQRNLALPSEAIGLIADYAQGNPSAAAQAIERLLLLAPIGDTDLENVREAIVDEARYGTFECVDAALAGDAAGTLHMLRRLAEAGTAPPQLLWVIARDLRLLASWRWASELGGPRPQVWDSRRSLIAAAARRRQADSWQSLLVAAAEADRCIKGRAPGNAWTRLERLLLTIAGVAMPEAA